MEQITSKEYFIQNIHKFDIYAKDNVKEIREYLETVCGCKKASWTTDNHLDLVWMYTGSDGCVYGDTSQKFETVRTQCTIDNLLDEYKLYNGCKPINLKGMTV